MAPRTCFTREPAADCSCSERRRERTEREHDFSIRFVGTVALGRELVLPVRIYLESGRLQRLALGRSERARAGTGLVMSHAPVASASEETTQPGVIMELIATALAGRTRFEADQSFSLLRALTADGTDLGKVQLASVLTPFQKRVFRRLLMVSAGSTITYGTLAAQMGTSPRAVGGALRRNPWPLLVPCHRVLQADGGIGGFSAPQGTGLKRLLLAYEAAIQTGGRGVGVEK